MENIPGGFPEMYPVRTPRQHNSTSTSVAEAAISSNNTSSTDDTLFAAHTRNLLKSRRRSFRKDLVFKLDCASYVYMLVLYLYDCSLILLLLRAGVQLISLILQYSTLVGAIVPKNAGKRTTFQSIILINFVCALTHYFRDLPLPESDGYIYGHHTLQVIGQLQLSNKMWFWAFDAILLYLQLLVFTSQYSLKKEEKLSRSSNVELEYDGAQGRTVAMKLPLLSVLKLPFVSVETLKAEDDQEREQLRRMESQIDSLLADDARQYGSINEELI